MFKCSGEQDVGAGAAGADPRSGHGGPAGGRQPPGQLRGREQPRAQGPRRHRGVLPRGPGRPVGDLQPGLCARQGPGQALHHPPGPPPHPDPQVRGTGQIVSQDIKNNSKACDSDVSV